jgi:hypothetical protein
MEFLMLPFGSICRFAMASLLAGLLSSIVRECPRLSTLGLADWRDSAAGNSALGIDSLPHV